jgi:hypothetical protein
LLAAALSMSAIPAAFAEDLASPATATLSSSAAGVKPVALTVTFRSELQCGRLTGAALVLKLPKKALVPVAIPASAVLVGGKPSARVGVAGRLITIALPARAKGIMTCDSIVIGLAKIVVTRAAGLGNPRPRGTYTVTVSHGAETFAAPLEIR